MQMYDKFQGFPLIVWLVRIMTLLFRAMRCLCCFRHEESECLVEHLLDPAQDFIKFNNNNGYVDGAKVTNLPDRDLDHLLQNGAGVPLGAISEDEDEDVGDGKVHVRKRVV